MKDLVSNPNSEIETASDGSILPFDPNLLLSSRDSGLQPVDCLAEIIDNSIEAIQENREFGQKDVGTIKIFMDMRVPPGKQKKLPHQIAVGDDGIGMDEVDIQKSLKLGWSSRFNSRKGMGRYGFGLTNGSISVCQLVEIYSKRKQGNWNYVALDLTNNKVRNIKKPEQKPLPEKFKNLVGDTGTLVTWSHIDKIRPRHNFDEETVNHFLARVFRKFIGDEIISDGKRKENKEKIKLTISNGIAENEVHAFDPLYVIPNKNLPNDETTTVDEELPIEFPIGDLETTLPEEIKTGKLIIRTSLTPESWRPEGRGRSGGTDENKKRYIPDNYGISVLRKGREIYYDQIRNLGAGGQDLDRFWSCEIDFDPILDKRFDIRNIKRGVSLDQELHAELSKPINQAGSTFRKNIRKVWDNTELTAIGESGVNDHGKTEEDVSDVIGPKENPRNTPEEEKAEAERIIEERKFEEHKAKELLKKLEDKNGPNVIVENEDDAHKDGQFIDFEPRLNKKLLLINSNHDFWRSVHNKLKKINELATQDEPPTSEIIELAASLKKDFDYIVTAFCDAYYDLDPESETKKEVGKTLKDLLFEWSKTLNRIYRNQQN